jgi:hypothetical protein
MPVVRCPECDRKLKVPGDRASVRCPACGHKWTRHEPDDEDRPVGRAAARKGSRAHVPSFLEQNWKAVLIGTVPIAILVPLALFLVSILFSRPAVAHLVQLGALMVVIGAFVWACRVAARHGNHVALDYLESLGPLRWLLVVGFLGFYLLGYVGLWFVAQVNCALHRPRAIIPCFGVQAYGVFLLLAASVVAGLSMPRWNGNQALLQPLGPRNRPNPANPALPANNPPAGRPGQGAAPPQEANAPPPRVTGDAALDQALADLGHRDGSVARAAAQRLADTTLNEHRPVVAKKLAEQLRTAEVYRRAAFIQALGVLATADEVPALIEMLSAEDINTRHEALKVLGKLRDERAAAPMVRCWLDFPTQWHAERALRDMGPAAEKEVLALVKHPEPLRAEAAVRLLGDIGTQASVPTLEAVSRDNPRLRDTARRALAAIAARSKG